jgi:5-methylcytosine-specific restriction endonuclease McrA
VTNYSLSHLSNETLLRDLNTLVTRDRITTAQLLAHLAEVDDRKLYAPAGYPSMYAFCVGEFHFSEEAAYKRIYAARAARCFPEIFTAVADGRLHLSAVVLLAPHLTEKTASDLIAAAAHRSKSEIKELLVARTPQPEVSLGLEAIDSLTPQALSTDQHAPGRVEEPAPQPQVTPLGSRRFSIRFTIDENTTKKLRYAEELFSHQIGPGDLAGLFERALDALIREGAKRKFAARNRPRRSSQRTSCGSRHIPAQVRRAVWERDQGQCTFVSESGRRCASRRLLEFDHVHPVARGGEATVANLRLRCRAHNQYEASATFGAEFMSRKRENARERAAAKRRANLAKERAEEVIPWLRQLGFRADEARWRAERCEAIPDASLEERVKFALSYLSPRIASRGRVAHASAGCDLAGSALPSG